MAKLKIVFADLEQNNLNAFIAYFRRQDNYHLTSCLSSTALLELLKTDINILVVDDKIIGVIGFDNFLKSIDKKTIVIALTANRSFETLELACAKGAIFKYHTKPFELDDLNRSIDEAINRFFGDV